jgi:hypothetical protein
MASKGKSLISTVNEDMLLENKYYKRYNKQKQKIKDKYPKDLWNRPIGLARNRKLNYDNHHLWQEYIKEVAQLMLTPNGWYQKFVWDTYSDSDKAQMEVRARGLGWGKNTN